MFYAAYCIPIILQKVKMDAEIAHLKRQSEEANELLRKLQAEIDAASGNVIDVQMNEVVERPLLEG